MDLDEEMMIHPGIHRDVPLNEYLSWPYLSKSGLHEFARCPALHRARVMGELPAVRRAYYDIGAAVDALWVEQRTLAEAGFVLRPDWLDLRTKEGKAWAAEHKGCTLVPADVTAIRDSLNGSRRACELRADAKPQLSLVWDCPRSGMRRKGRPDLVDFDARRVIDLKTTKAITRWSFEKDFSQYNYHWQLQGYIEALTILGHEGPWEAWIIAVETDPVYSVSCRPVAQESLDVAQWELEEQLQRYRSCLLARRWPRDDESEDPILLPKWRSR